MSKTTAIYIIAIVVVGVAIILGVAASNNSGSGSHSHAQAVQQNDQCCADGHEHAVRKGKAWNEVCPVMGGRVQENSVTHEHNEKHYGFCCPGCIDQFAGTPEKFAANLSEDGKEFIKK